MELIECANLFQGAKNKLKVNVDGTVDIFPQLKNNKYIAETKYDGIYCTCWWDKNGRVSLISKTGKRKDNLQLLSLVDYLETLNFKETALLGELAFGSQRGTEYHIKHGCHKIDFFDIVVWNGVYIGKDPLIQRKNKLEDVLKDYSEDNKYLTLSKYVAITSQAGLQQYYETAVRNGEEGIMLKSANSTHSFGKANNDWYKVKKLVTMDYVIMGYTESDSEDFRRHGYIGAVIGGLYFNGFLKSVCQIGSMDHSWKSEFGANGDKYLGKVMTCVGYEVFKSGALRHPFFSGIHPDKEQRMCTWEDDAENTEKDEE